MTPLSMAIAYFAAMLVIAGITTIIKSFLLWLVRTFHLNQYDYGTLFMIRTRVTEYGNGYTIRQGSFFKSSVNSDTSDISPMW